MRRRDLMALLTGAAIASPLAGRAQQPMPLIGYLSVGSRETDNLPERLVAFRQGLNEGGIEGQNVAIEYAWAQGRDDQLSGLTAGLVRRQSVGDRRTECFEGGSCQGGDLDHSGRLR